MKRKIMVGLLVGCMAVMALVGCGNNDQSSDVDNNSSDNGTVATQSATEATDEMADSTCFVLASNGGTMTFEYDSETFELEKYCYWMMPDNTLKSVMTDESKLISIEKEGAEFTGWTIYKADSVDWSAEKVDKEGVECFLYDSDIPEMKYLLVENAEVYKTSATTEEMCEIAYNGDNYYAVANWE